MPAYREVTEDSSEEDYDALSEENSASTKFNCAVEKEKQISVDPLSLKQLANVGANLYSDRAPVAGAMQLLAPPPVLVRPKFVSCSLPGSALSSPKSGSAMPRSPKKHSRFAWEQNASLRRSKSCGEGRSSSPSVEFTDIMSRRQSTQLHSDEVAHVIDEPIEDGSSFKDPQPLLIARGDDKFKCGCLFLPGLSHRKKQVMLQQASQVQLHMQQEKQQPLQLNKVGLNGLQGARESTDKSRISTVSKAASLEKFSCGSWSSSALLGSDGEDGRHSYFDLPLELIRGGHDDTDSPVRAAFVFEKDLKGVLKKSSSNLASRKSHTSSSNRHVRFSTSAPTSYPASPSSTCITPRLRKAREEFNAFLAA